MSEVNLLNNFSLKTKDFMKKLIRPIKMPGWLLTLYNVFNIVPSSISNTEFWFNLTKNLSLLITSPLNITLAIAGTLWLIFVGKEEQHLNWKNRVFYITLCIIVMFLVTILVKTVFTEIQFYIKKEITRGIAGLAIDEYTKKSSNTQQIPLTQDLHQLSSDQQRALLLELNNLRPKISTVYICRDTSDHGTHLLSTQIIDIFARAGLKPQTCSLQPSGIEDEGISIKTENTSSSSTEVKKIQEVFDISNIRVKISEAPNGFFRTISNPNQFIIYIGPIPMRWR